MDPSMDQSFRAGENPLVPRTWGGRQDVRQGPITLPPWKQSEFNTRHTDTNTSPRPGTSNRLNLFTGPSRPGTSRPGTSRPATKAGRRPGTRQSPSRPTTAGVPLWHGGLAVVPDPEMDGGVGMDAYIRALSQENNPSRPQTGRPATAVVVEQQPGAPPPPTWGMRQKAKLWRIFNFRRLKAAERINRTAGAVNELDESMMMSQSQFRPATALQRALAEEPAPAEKPAPADEGLADRKKDVPHGFIKLGPPLWVFAKRPTPRLLLGGLALILGFIMILVAVSSIHSAAPPQKQGTKPLFKHTGCLHDGDCVPMLNCYQHYCLNSTYQSLPQYNKPANMTDRECSLEFNCLSAEASECKCVGYLCSNTASCPKQTLIGKYILLAVGLLLLGFGIPALLLAKTYRFILDDETKSASYARYNPVLRCFKRGQKDIPYEELNEITCTQFVHTDKFSAASKYVQLEMPDEYIFTFFVGNQTLADEQLARWRHFMSERVNYEPEKPQSFVIQAQAQQRIVVERPRRKSDDWMDEDIENAPNPFAGPPQLLTDSGSEDGEHEHRSHLPQQQKKRRRSLAPLPPVGHGRRVSVAGPKGASPKLKVESPLRREPSVHDARHSATPPSEPQQALLRVPGRGEALSDTHEESDTEQPLSDNNHETYSDGVGGHERGHERDLSVASQSDDEE